MKTKDEIFTILRRCVLAVLPELEGRNITPQDSLKELGANSIDRAEIIIQTLANLDLKIPLLALGAARNMSELVNLMHEKIQKEVVVE